MYKIIACDLDETLLDSSRKISKENLEAIKKAKSLGVKFVPATGRGYCTVSETLKELELYDLDNEYVISFNGGAITENKDTRLLHFKGISFQQATDLFSRGLDYDVCIHVYTKTDVYVYNFSDEEANYLIGRMPVIEFKTPNLEFLKDEEIVKILFMNTNFEYLKQIETDFKDITEMIDVSFSSNRYIEFNHLGVNKGAGLLSLAKLLGVKIEETIAIGDNYNDLSMIKAAGLGVGVKNVAPGMVKDCDYITKATHDESAIAEVINKFIL